MNRGHFEINIDEILDGSDGEAFGVVMRQVQHALFDRVMVKARGNKSVACQILGISRVSLNKMQNLYYRKDPLANPAIENGKRLFMINIV